jgi:hypothetical protein
MNRSGNQVSILEVCDLIPADSAVQAQRSHSVDRLELREPAIEHERRWAWNKVSPDRGRHDLDGFEKPDDPRLRSLAIFVDRWCASGRPHFLRGRRRTGSTPHRFSTTFGRQPDVELTINGLISQSEGGLRRWAM